MEFRQLCAGVTHPQPPLESSFLFDNELFVAWRFPLLIGDKGVCYGEMRGLV